MGASGAGARSRSGGRRSVFEGLRFNMNSIELVLIIAFRAPSSTRSDREHCCDTIPLERVYFVTNTCTVVAARQAPVAVL
jgi:hypothetical protein